MRLRTRYAYAAAALLIAAVASVVWWPRGAPVQTAALRFPNVGSILVLTDRLPGYDHFVSARAQQVAIALRYLSPQTSWAHLDAVSPAEVRRASAVVYLGLNGLHHLSPRELAILHAARRLIVSQHHVSDLRKGGIAFRDVAGGVSRNMPPGTTVSYRGMTAPVSLDELLDVSSRQPAHVLASYALPDHSHVPYIIVDGAAMFVNAPLAFTSQNGVHGAMLAACDAIASFLGAPSNAKPLAMLRLEDVSAIASPARLAAIAYYLWRARVPYGIGVIPDLRVQGGKGGPLRDNPALVAVLRWAQGHGATIILHGLHHCCSSHDAEGYEFWDHDHDRPVAEDSAAWMRWHIVDGLTEERSLGLQPLMWETPHYSASPLDYFVVARFFPAAWELRRPDGWLPWPLQRDQYGSLILPENLGYVSLDGVYTVADQLARARAMLACRYCVAAGFLHPALVNVFIVRDYVQGLRAMGYAFVDPRQAIAAARD